MHLYVQREVWSHIFLMLKRFFFQNFRSVMEKFPDCRRNFSNKAVKTAFNVSTGTLLEKYTFLENFFLYILKVFGRWAEEVASFDQNYSASSFNFFFYVPLGQLKMYLFWSKYLIFDYFWTRAVFISDIG